MTRSKKEKTARAKTSRPGPRACFCVLGLLFEALADLVLLPIRLAWFMMRRKKVSMEISSFVERGKDG